MEWLAGREGRAREERHGTSGIWGWCSSVQNCRPESDQLIRHMNSASSSYAVKSRDWRAKQGVASSVARPHRIEMLCLAKGQFYDIEPFFFGSFNPFKN